MSKGQEELCYLTIREASRLIKSKELSPVELTRAFLERIQAVDSQLKSYITILPKSALAEARTAEAEVLRGDYLGPLHGIPVALKDLYATKGVRTTAGSKVLECRVPSEDATATARLRHAGSVLLGKLAMDEFAMGGSSTSLFDAPRNPWNLAYMPGGSSSGSGAAVAGGLCMGALGSDTGGSIRGPASFCGIVGLKPTYGLVSRYGVTPLSWSLDHCGPMTKTVDDTALMLQVIAGYDPKDPASNPTPIPDYSAALREDIKDLVIGVPRHYFVDTSEEVDPEAVAAVEKALADLEGLGAVIEELEIPSLEYVGIANTVILQSEAFTYHRRTLQSQPQNYEEIARRRLYLGGLITAADYVQAQRVRSRARREFAQILQRVHVLAMPTTPKPADTFVEFDPTPLESQRKSFTRPFNQTGMPAISIPCGFTTAGLPLGLQIAGKPFDESTVLRVAYTYQQHARWYEKRPPI